MGSLSGEEHLGGPAYDADGLRRELERLRVLASRDRGLLSAILTHSPHGIIVCDAAGRLVLFNRAAERIWGGSTTADRIADWASYRAFHRDGRPYRGDEWGMARALRDGEVVETEEVEIERFDGTRGVILASAAPIYQGSALGGAISAFADITEFKENERALLARERGTADRLARLHAFTAALSEAADIAEVARVTVDHGRAALDAASGGLWIARPDGAAELLHGDGAAPDAHERYAHVPAGADLPVAHVLRDGNPIWIPSRADAERRWPVAARSFFASHHGEYAAACLPLEVRAGRIGVLHFSYGAPREFTADERALLLALARQAAQALERARLFEAERSARADSEAAQRRTAFLSEASALLGSSLEYGDTLASVARLAVPRVADWCAVDLVESFTRGPVVVAHVDPKKVELASELARRHPPDARAPLGVPRVLRTGESELYEDLADALPIASAHDAEHLRLARELGLRSAMIVAMNARGRTLGALTFVSAESGRRYGAADLVMAESLARRAALAIDNARLYAEAQQAIRARDDVLAIVSHDLRNPLHAIVMASNLLSRPTADRSRTRAHAAAIERAAQRMGRLIRDLLDSSRLESGRFVLDRQPALAASLLGEAAALIQPIAAEKRVGIEIAPGAESLGVHCDRERVLQVLSNLLGNAVTFTPAAGRVTLAAVPLPTGDLRFSVADTGRGIAPEHQERIFDRYWKSRESRLGTGLGLAIAKGIVEAHGGRIWVESAPGEGATFHFTLSAAEALPPTG